MKLLGKVEAVFSISCCGVATVSTGLLDLGLGIGDSIQYRRLDGQIRNTRVARVGSANQGKGKPRRPNVLLPLDVAKDDIIEGMEIWSLEH